MDIDIKEVINFYSIGISILTSLIASLIFWYLSFSLTGTKVVFSDCIEKKKLVDKEGYRYRIKVMNCGSRDFFEVSFSARLVVFIGSKQYTTYLRLGEDIPRPVLKGRDFKEPCIYTTFLPELEINEITLREFKKDFYPKHIRDKAENKDLTIEDLFDEFEGNIHIQAFVFGNDAKTGARKMFKSEKYTGFNEGEFVLWTGPSNKLYKLYFPSKRAKKAISEFWPCKEDNECNNTEV